MMSRWRSHLGGGDSGHRASPFVRAAGMPLESAGWEPALPSSQRQQQLFDFVQASVGFLPGEAREFATHRHPIIVSHEHQSVRLGFNRRDGAVAGQDF